MNKSFLNGTNAVQSVNQIKGNKKNNIREKLTTYHPTHKKNKIKYDEYNVKAL